MTIKEIRQHKNNTIRQQIFTYLIHVRKEISFIDTRFFTVSPGIIRSFVGTVNTDRVNGGILATTSFFTRDAYNFISDNKWNCQIKTHDYNVIRNLLTQVVTNT